MDDVMQLDQIALAALCLAADRSLRIKSLAWQQTPSTWHQIPTYCRFMKTVVSQPSTFKLLHFSVRCTGLILRTYKSRHKVLSRTPTAYHGYRKIQALSWRTTHPVLRERTDPSHVSKPRVTAGDEGGQHIYTNDSTSRLNLLLQLLSWQWMILPR